MRNLVLPTAVFCSLIWGASNGVSQTAPTSGDDGAPYGGVTVAAGSAGPVGPSVPGPLNSGDPPCTTGGNADPCVLTGQYSRYRTSTNVNETTLANISDFSSFGMATLYQLTSTLPGPPGTITYEPVVAQPLYVTNVPQSDGSTKNLVVIASLNDYVYAFNTATNAQLWQSNNLASTSHCGPTGVPFHNNNNAQPGAVPALPYYGIVATPVIDIAPTPPVAFVVSACTASWNSTAVHWYLDAIGLRAGQSLATTEIASSAFHPQNQLARASLLLTRPSAGGVFLYVSFGSGVGEVFAAGSGGSTYAYSGFLFGYQIQYSPSVGFTSLGSSPFTTSCPTGAASCTTQYGAVFPSVYSNFDSSGAPLGPSCGTGSSCDHGDNWAVSQGGIWMSSKGPASTETAAVYLAAGNGPFACTDAGTSQCKNPATVRYWGESAFKFPAATLSPALSMGVPSDFFAPYVVRYPSGYDSSPPPYQTQELSRLDLDFGASGMVMISHTASEPFAMTTDKLGNLYVMPAGSNSLGMFQMGDLGLTGGTVTTQTPFSVSRSQLGCPTNSSGTIGSGTCDEVRELAWFDDLMFVWPTNEAVEVFQGGYSNGTNTYSFPTAPAFDPCNTPGNCTGTNPHFPAPILQSQGVAMAVAADSSNHTTFHATLWGVVPVPPPSTSGRLWGTFYAYTVNSGGSLTYLWDNVTGHNCSNPPAKGWYVPSFTEPTLANGAVYVPTMCTVSVTDTNNYQNCKDVPASSVGSGVLVFKSCS